MSIVAKQLMEPLVGAMADAVHTNVNYLLAKEQNKVMRDHYRIGDLLGTGAYGQVRKCVYKEDMKDRNSPVKEYRAVKILSKAHMEDKDIDAFKEEVACMMELQKESLHPSLVRLYHIFDDPKRLLLVQELFHGGDLYDYMVKNKSKLESHDAAIIIK